MPKRIVSTSARRDQKQIKVYLEEIARSEFRSILEVQDSSSQHLLEDFIMQYIAEHRHLLKQDTKS